MTEEELVHWHAELRWKAVARHAEQRFEKMVREADEEGERAWINNEDYVGLIDSPPAYLHPDLAFPSFQKKSNLDVM